MSTRTNLRILLILLAGALFLFFYGSGQSFRSDEVWSLRTVAMPYPEMMDEVRSDVHPPLYYWLLAGWTKVAGTSEIVARMLSILLTLAAAVAVYFGARSRLGERGGLVAAALFIASPLSTLAAQMVRMYGLLVLASAVSTVAFLRLSGQDARKRDLWISVAANIVGSFTHVWFFFLLFAQGCAYLVFHRTRGLGRMAVAAVVSLAPYAALWLPVLLQQIRRTDSALAWAPPPGLADVGQTAFLLAGWSLAAIPFLRSWWKGENRAKAAEPALIALIAITVPFLISQVKPVYWPRFTIVALPALCMAAAALAPAVKKHYFETALVSASAVLAVIVSTYAAGCDARSTAQYLARHAQTGDVVVFTNLSRLPVDYYWDRIQPVRGVVERSFPAEIDSHPGFAGRPKHLGDEAASLVDGLDGGGTSRVFFLHGFRPAEDAPLKNLLDTRLAPVEELKMACASMGSYFQYLSAYSCAPRLTALIH